MAGRLLANRGRRGHRYRRDGCARRAAMRSARRSQRAPTSPPPRPARTARSAVDRAGHCLRSAWRRSLASREDGCPPRCGGKRHPLSPNAARMCSTDGAVAVVMFTSGTTGRSKAVPLTWDNLCNSAARLKRCAQSPRRRAVAGGASPVPCGRPADGGAQLPERELRSSSTSASMPAACWPMPPVAAPPISRWSTRCCRTCWPRRTPISYAATCASCWAAAR